MAPKQSATDWLAVDPVVSNELRPWYDHNGVKSLWHVKIHQSGYQTWFLGCAFIWFGIYTMHWLQVACIVVSLHIWSFATEDRGCPTTSWRRRSLPSSFQYEQMDQDELFVCWSCPTWGHLGSFVRYCQKCKACLSRQTCAYYNLCQRKQCGNKQFCYYNKTICRHAAMHTKDSQHWVLKLFCFVFQPKGAFSSLSC